MYKPIRYLLPLFVVFSIFMILNNLPKPQQHHQQQPQKNKISNVHMNRIKKAMREHKINQRFQKPVNQDIKQSRKVVKQETKDFNVENYKEESPLNPADYSSSNKNITEHFAIQEKLLKPNTSKPINQKNLLNKDRTNAILKQKV